MPSDRRVADPTCARCGGRAVYIGIGPGAEPACARECAGRCPRCLATEIEAFAPWGYWSLGLDAPPRMHCLPCGHVFDKEPA